MFKKLLIIFLLIISIFSVFFLVWNNTSANSIKVENIFSDIDSNYEYLNELQTLYDKWMIFPDSDWRFNPRALLNRDEFVWILMEVTCKKCIQPYATTDLINKYINSQVFYDIGKSNKYFYCVEDANDSWFVKGYHPWTICENWVQRDWEKPFCPSNTITLEEAIAVVLRASWILTNQQAEKVRQDIYNWIITENIADDVSPKNLDGSVYSFYPDLAKALNYEITEVDLDWNLKTYKLIEKKDWKLRPKQAISKEYFLHIAYVALKANACWQKQENNIALKMNIFNKECSESDKNCSISDLKDIDNTYDFWNDLYTTCESWVKNPEWYIWRFYNNYNWNQIIKYWNYLNNYSFLNTWKWTVFLRVIDNCWNTAEVYNTINVNNKEQTSFWLEVDASPVYGNWPLDVDLTAKPDGWEWPYVCSWDYWDWISWVWIDVNHIFENSWTYEVTTTCNDKNGLTSTATSTIYVTDINKEQTSFWLEVDASPVYGNWPLDVDLTAKPDGWEWPYVCSWDYGDWISWIWIDVNHIFENSWTYEVTTTCNDVNGLTSTATSIIYVVNSEKNIWDLKVSINADPIYWTWPLLVNFDWIVSGWVWPYSYSWDFWDWNTWYWKKIKNIFKNDWIYEVLLIVTDSLWKTVKATVLIQVIWQNCNIDSDNDWVNNCDDVLPLVPWDKRNKWAPILERECNIDNDCKSWYICTNDTNVCLPKELATSCEYTWWDVLFWNVSCNSCPCNISLDFTSTLRKCDIIFPAITSPDATQIYWKWWLFQIK